ncbi:Chromo domain-containing protein [Cucumis melo var. makuwa]|uniref:Chromo domain-containing protein n=1 Tax=Cucumis melo var. makuwa TaxID=1194695 RepID=A0A5A7TEF6_CUCMM|nr:Chromo domain-containing protein [Cucumis melo var. makuwa]
MKEGTSVREHVLDMMMHFNISEVNGGDIDEATQLEDNSLPPFESCLEGKTTKRSFTRKGLRAKVPLQLVHSNFCGSINLNSRGGKYILDPSHVLREQPVELKEDLSYDEEPVQILDRKEQVLRNKTIPLIKVLWRHHGVEEATWELEDQMKKRYLILFS